MSSPCSPSLSPSPLAFPPPSLSPFLSHSLNIHNVPGIFLDSESDTRVNKIVTALKCLTVFLLFSRGQPEKCIKLLSSYKTIWRCHSVLWGMTSWLMVPFSAGSFVQGPGPERQKTWVRNMECYYPQHSIATLSVCFCTSPEPSSLGHCQEGHMTPVHAVAGITGEYPELREFTSFTVGSVPAFSSKRSYFCLPRLFHIRGKFSPDSLSSHPSLSPSKIKKLTHLK